MDKPIIQSGELIVVKQGKIKIHLDHRLPCRAMVKFLHEKQIVPCNPNHFDEVEWEIVRHNHNSYLLEISWKVSDVRTIEWAVFY